MSLPSVPLGAGVQLKGCSSRRRRPQGANALPAGARRRSFCATATVLLAITAWAFTAAPAIEIAKGMDMAAASWLLNGP
jgi:hypothetical protein